MWKIGSWKTFLLQRGCAQLPWFVWGRVDYKNEGRSSHRLFSSCQVHWGVHYDLSKATWPPCSVADPRLVARRPDLASDWHREDPCFVACFEANLPTKHPIDRVNRMGKVRPYQKNLAQSNPRCSGAGDTARWYHKDQLDSRWMVQLSPTLVFWYEQ